MLRTASTMPPHRAPVKWKMLRQLVSFYVCMRVHTYEDFLARYLSSRHIFPKAIRAGEVRGGRFATFSSGILLNAF